MKKALKYIIILAVSAALTLLYGFCIGGDLSLWITAVIFFGSAFTLIIFERKEKSNLQPIVKLLKTAAISFLMVAFSIILYGEVSSSSQKSVGTFEATVTDVVFAYRNHSYSFSINTPDGEELSIDVGSGELLPDRGDRVVIAEYEGLFGDAFYQYLGKSGDYALEDN